MADHLDINYITAFKYKIQLNNFEYGGLAGEYLPHKSTSEINKTLQGKRTEGIPNG
jgi:hypothetical protein